MKTFNGLPLFEDKITDEACGMLRISLVDLPAVESDFQKFGKPVLVQLTSEAKRLITGVVMRAGFPIYRRDASGEYYTSFSAETIRTMAEKYLAENRANRVNLMHSGEEVRGVQMVELFIKDSEKGIVPKGFEDIEDGSLFATFHVADDEIWGWIREGILRGFSLEGIFDMQESEITEDMKINFNKVKAVLAKIVSKFTQTATDKGVLTYEGELEVGKDVYFIEPDGEITDADDGEYKTEDGTVIVVADSKIADIRKPEEEPAEETMAEEMPEGEVADDVDIHNLAAEVERIKAELDHKKDEIAELKDRVSELETKNGELENAMRKMSSAKTPAEEIKGEEETSSKKFRSAHDKFLYELNKSK